MSAAPNSSLFALAPHPVWAHFATLCAIPRASKHEGPLREHLRQWAAQRGLAATVDAAGNLLVRKPASPGRERAPGLALQAHLDMVCQKNDGVAHDFARDPIHAVVRDGWAYAEGTTLGADNGMGVALMLAVLESDDLVHGPLEALFTVDEEAGMGGARGLAPGLLRSRLMLNLDTEEWGEFYLGCAGGMDVSVSRSGGPGVAEAPPAGSECWRIALRGLRGGHSGVNIHEQRGNAIKLLVRVLCDLAGAPSNQPSPESSGVPSGAPTSKALDAPPGKMRAAAAKLPLRLAQLTGGTARNALPREAVATVALPAGCGALLAEALAGWQRVLRCELAGVDEALELSAEPLPADAVAQVLTAAEQAVWLRSLHAAPHGVRSMSRAVPGVVETSNNLGMVELTPTGGRCNFMVRSLLDSGSEALGAEIASLFELSASTVERGGRYPGWAPDPASPLLARCQAVFRHEFGEASTVKVIHAGLECGIIGATYPGLDIVSFGPTIHGAHAPGEAVEIASVARTWQLLAAILADLAAVPAAAAA